MIHTNSYALNFKIIHVNIAELYLISVAGTKKILLAGVIIIRPSTALRNEYLQISAMAKATGEPIYITNKGEADGIFMSVEAFKRREKMLAHRASILEIELCRLAGATTYSIEDVRAHLKEKYQNG